MNLRVLISGAGIAGPATAHWLNRYGCETTIVDTAPAPRKGGYVIDFWGAGFDVAERMGILPELRQRSLDQRTAKNFAKSIVPHTRLGIWFRNQVTRLMVLPFVAHIALKEYMVDPIVLENYQPK